MEGDSGVESKSVTCLKLPDSFIIDKQEAKKFMSQFGLVKSFILRPSKSECTVEFETHEAAQQALNADVNFEIIPTKPEHLKPAEDFIDPDVQSELQAMLPVSAKTFKPSVETLMKNPFKSSKMFPAPKQKIEPLAVSVQADPRLVQAAKTELDNLTRKPAFSAEEKFAILDARDKLYRAVNAKPANIKNAMSTKGTCKDMCPEKERLMRVARLQVASFELDDKREMMDPKRAIKQYSRSSADQEIPLPHELRSEDVLKTTMTYILHNIINLCDDEDISVGDWYHFVWDRTRGIRKDITQQELCSLTTVELLEQCARFHIHCSARLIAEDPGIFDQRINDENLTKSLQTLKYMYDDLKLKNIKCPNEAEFRAYVVLLNLNESGNFLWEIKRLEKDILNSQEMRFALDVYFAVALNNYVKFFNLVREASYMNACILLKYFTQIRLKAIFTIMRSYTQRRGTKFGFNLSYLTEILLFENYESTANFMTYHGGECDLDADTVNLNPSSFANVTAQYQMERAFETVESKLEATIAEAICGGELPSPDCFLKIEPHSSFDDNGYLKKSAYYAEDQNGPSNVFKVPKESPPVSPAAKLFQTKNAFSRPGENIFGSVPFNKTTTSTPFHSDSPFSMHKAGASIFGDFSNTPNTNMKIASIFGQSPKTPSSTDSSSSSEVLKVPTINPYIFARPMQESPKSTGIFSQTTSPFSSDSSISEQEEERKRLEAERIRKENEAAEQMLRRKLAEKAQQEQEKREAMERLERQKRKEEERLKRELEELKQRKLQEQAEELLDSLLDEIVESKVKTEMALAEMLYVKMPNDFYNAIEHDVIVEELIKLYGQELLGYINLTRRKYESLYRNFEHWRVVTQKEKRKREKLASIGCSALNKSLEEHAKAIMHPQQSVTLSNMKQYLSGSPQQLNVPDLDAYKGIDMFTDVKMPQDLPSKLFWKVVASVPMRNEENCIGFSCFIRKWLGKMFAASDDEQDVMHLKHKDVHHSRVSICMRKVQGIEQPLNAVANANSILFFCTTSNLSETRRRLNNLLDKLDKSVAVSVILYKNVIESTDEILVRKYFDLSMEPRVKSFEINLFYECKEKSKDLRQVVIESCQFLYDNYLYQMNTEFSKLYDLEMKHVLDFFQDYFGDEMWQRIEFSCRDSKEFYSRMSSFNNVIKIYNQCVDKIIGIISTDFKSLPSLPDEFRASLPVMEVRIPHSFEYFPADWKVPGNQKNLIAFLHDLKLVPMQNDKFENFKDFQGKMHKFLDMNFITSDIKSQVFHAIVDKIIQHFYLMQLKAENAIDKMRWLKIFECIVVGKYNEIYQQKQRDLPEIVIYSKKDMRCYLVPWWYVSSLSSDNAENEPSSKKQKVTQNFNIKDMDEVLKKGYESLKRATDIVNNSRENTMKTRQDSKVFDQYLSKCEEKSRGIKRTLLDKFQE